MLCLLSSIALPAPVSGVCIAFVSAYTYIGCVSGLFDGPKCKLQQMWRGLFQNGSRVCSFSSMEKRKVKGIRANLHAPVPFYSPGLGPGGRVVRQESVSDGEGTGRAARSAVLVKLSVRVLSRRCRGVGRPIDNSARDQMAPH